MSKWYRGADGWEDGYEVIDLLGEGDFIAVRRWVSDNRVLYEGYFWNAATDERKAAYLDVIVDGSPTLWIDAQIILRRYEVYENIENGELSFFIFDGDGNIEFHATYTDPVELHRVLREFHHTGSVVDWDPYWGEYDKESAQKHLHECRENSDRFILVADHNGTYLRERYAFLKNNH